MRKHGWGNGAKLMETWFSGPSAIAPAYGWPDTATIRMDSWVLTFPRARSVYDRLMRERIWANPDAQREIAAMLSRKGLLRYSPPTCGESGPIERSLTWIEKYDIVRHHGEQAGKIAGVDCINPSRMHFADLSFIRAYRKPPSPSKMLGRMNWKLACGLTLELSRAAKRRRLERLVKPH